MEGSHFILDKILGIICWSYPASSETLCFRCYGSNAGLKFDLLCPPHPFLELDGRFLCRVSVLRLDVFLAANTCHGFMLLFLQISQKHVAIQIIQCCRMVEQLGNGHGHFHGLVYSIGHSAFVASGIGRFVAEGMARLCDFSHELHWELGAKQYSVALRIGPCARDDLSRVVWRLPSCARASRARFQVEQSRRALMEIAYTTSQLAACLQLQTALAMIQVGFGFPFHFIHFAAVITEHIFFHRMVQFKFAWLHKLFHEVQPLHRLVHLEQHICKGTYPTTPAAGLWEGWLCGGTLLFCNTLACVPYLFLHAVSSGPNAVIHTMWPHKFCIQWRTLHHLANSAIYAANVPSENDKKFSRDVQKYKEKMKCSVSTRYSSASDVAGFAMSLIVGVIVHYTCRIGLFHTWKERAFRFTGWSRASGRIHLTEPA